VEVGGHLMASHPKEDGVPTNTLTIK